MPKLRVHNLAMSVDGYIAGPDQSVNPLGVGGMLLHGCVFATRSFARTHGTGGGEGGLDDGFVARGDAGLGATIMVRNIRFAAHGATTIGVARGGQPAFPSPGIRAHPSRTSAYECVEIVKSSAVVDVRLFRVAR